MPLQDFIRDYILYPQEGSIGYLAQHDLFSQIPQLREDILPEPDYCAVLPEDECNGNILSQIWFGPIGTYSPLHHDPYHNLLVQIVGIKSLEK